MLTEFRLSNFRSFLGPQRLSFVAPARSQVPQQADGPTLKSRPPLSRNAVIFGAAGSGKSNLVAAIGTLHHLLLRSHLFSSADLAACYTPFRFGRSSTQPVMLGFDVLLDGIRYAYDVAFDAQRITWERLRVYRTGKAQRWYERCALRPNEPEMWAPFSVHLHGAREYWRRATRPTGLFLSTAVNMDCHQLHNLHAWCERGFSVDLRKRSMDGISKVLQTPRLKGALLQAMSRFDIPVADVRLKPVEVPENPIALQSAGLPQISRISELVAPIELMHRVPGGASWVCSEMESRGVQQILITASLILAAMDGQELLVLDGFGTNIHPLVSAVLLRIANEDDGGRNQLLLTTHETTLMTLNTLRPDELWLLDLNDQAASVLSTVLRVGFKRPGSVQARYLRGTFGGVPRVGAAGSAADLRPGRPTSDRGEPLFRGVDSKAAAGEGAPTARRDRL